MSTVTATSQLHGQPITMTADTNYGGAISSIIWNGVQYVEAPTGSVSDNGQEIQSAIHSYASPANPALGECYNPNEAGCYTDEGTSSTTEVLSMAASGGVLTTSAYMAYYANYKTGSRNCSTPLNTTAVSGVLLNKTVTLGFNANIPQAIEYQVSMQIPSNYAYPAVNSFEFVAWYLPNTGSYARFNTFLQNNPIIGVNTDVTSVAEEEGNGGVIQANYPVILSYGDADYAAGIYCPSVQASTDYNYDQFYYGDTGNKLGIVAYINNIPVANQPIYSLTFYLVIGSLADVNSGLAALIQAYPPPAPIISYQPNNFTFVKGASITSFYPNNVGGPFASCTITPNLNTNTGLTFNTTTGSNIRNPKCRFPGN